MYTGQVACCPLASDGEYADRTDKQTVGRTDARRLHYAFRYGCGQCNKSWLVAFKFTSLVCQCCMLMKINVVCSGRLLMCADIIRVCKTVTVTCTSRRQQSTKWVSSYICRSQWRRRHAVQPSCYNCSVIYIPYYNGHMYAIWISCDRL